MAQQLINVGDNPNDRNGDTLRVGANKINSNFSELYNRVGFNYIGSTEPISPVNGFRWMEVVSGNLVGRWEWISAVSEWVAIREYDIYGVRNAGTAATVAAQSDFTPRKRFVKEVRIEYVSSGTWNGSNSVNVSARLGVLFTTGGVYATPQFTINTATSSAFVESVNAVYTFARTAYVRSSLVGSPGTLDGMVNVRARDCRI